MRLCFFVILTFVTLGPAAAQAPSFLSVQRIVLLRCAPCHRPGEAAPFSLLTYEDIARRAGFIKKVISEGYMPPWKADDHYRAFANDRALAPEEREAILRWVDAGAPAAASPGGVAPFFPGTAYTRPPDLTLKIDSPYLVPGDDAERFIVFKLPYELPADRNVEAVELYCNNRKIIHHINYGFYAVPDTAVSIFGGSPYIDGDRPGSQQREYDVLKRNFTYYTGWIPGASAESYPPGFGWTLPRRGVVLLTVHYTALGADEHSIVGVNLFFTPKPIHREVKIISLGSGGVGEELITPPLLLLAGRVDTFRLQVKTQEDQSLLYVWPHMHYLGKEFTAWAETPSGDTIPLVHIPRWDFRWQELYRFKHPVRLPAGSVVHVTGVYDNTADNPFNPSSPPRLVLSTGNMTSRDEMMTLMLIYVGAEEGDEKIVL
ncbi:cytochrome c [Dinghuibacter silviterrae]|uniref:Copper type II ascorbate-dependent monooxygenase-like protein n=1 Tax=Dinghuibacter silviterrae TaxID=1539049 RepID=A0A4R8DQ97_9BACT|nr:cytochrome c [Dinghuibacter silviterrae]TDX00312.1 hypothetical protein EDB95_1333 [Dinghuibacter silviterrae]